MPNLPIPVGGQSVAAALRFDEALGAAVNYAEAEKAASTRRAYASDFADFTRWCEAAGSCPLPAAVPVVAAYLAALARAGRKASTIARRQAAITDRHRRAGLDPPTSAEPVRAVCRGIRRTIGTRVDQKAPIRAKELKAMIKPIPDTLAGRRDRALLLIGFSAALRRSELVALQVADIERMPEGVLVHVRRSKTDQEGAGRTVPVPHGSKLGAVSALDAWLASAGIAEGPLFRSVDKAGQIGAAGLSGQAVADIVKRWAGTAKLDASLFAGHSLRAGFATTALEHKADILKVMDVTGHRSVQTLKKYDRRAKAFDNHAGKGFL